MRVCEGGYRAASVNACRQLSRGIVHGLFLLLGSALVGFTALVPLEVSGVMAVLWCLFVLLAA